MPKSNRDEFSAKTKRDLAARAGHVCSFPGCGHSTSGPSAEAGDATVNLGEASHISAAASGPGARRYNPALTAEERSSIENGIWLCRMHAKLIDSDEARYTVERLQRMKREAERRAELRLRSGSDDLREDGLAYRAKLPARDFFVPRRELDMVRGTLTQAAGSTVGITTALRGAGGFGKTALARALCDDPDVRQAFPDGILWTTMGESLHDGDRVDRLLDLVRWWTHEEPPGFKSARDAGEFLNSVVGGKRVLVVVDDVWQAADLMPFRALEVCTVLATTRNVRTLPEDAVRFDVDAMAADEAVALLEHGLPPAPDGRLWPLAERLGEWPLLLRLVNSQLQDLVHHRGLEITAALERIASKLDTLGLRAFNRRDAKERIEAMSLTMDLSLETLQGADRQRFLDLAVFPEGVEVPLGVVAQMWGLEALETEEFCLQLEDFSLLLDLNLGQETLRLHDVVRQYLIDQHQDLTAVHRQLLEECQPRSGRWNDLEGDERYLWRHLAGHLVGAGDRVGLRGLLFDFDFLEAKLRVVGINGLLADFDELGEAGDPRTVQEALRLSAHIASQEWHGLLGQVLAGQLQGRLSAVGEAVQGLLQQAADCTPLRPRRVRLGQTGGPLIRTLGGHIRGVVSVAVLDEKHVVSASNDHTLRVWDVEAGETLRTLEGHTDAVKAVAVLDQARVVSTSRDNTLRVWDVGTGETLRMFEAPSFIRATAVAVLDEKHVVWGAFTLRVREIEHGEAPRMLKDDTLVISVAVLDEKSVVSASYDNSTLRVWDVESGEMVRTLEGHTSPVTAVAALDEKHVVSASEDNTLRVWDVESGETLRTFEGHSETVLAVAVLDEKRMVSASRDNTLRVWDVKSGETFRTLEGHTSPVTAVAALNENRVVSVSYDKTLRVWDVEAGETLCPLEDHTSLVTAVAVMDEKRAVSASYDNTLRVWDIESGETLRKLEAHTSNVTTVAVLDEKRVVSTSYDNTLRVWDVESGKTLRKLEGHTKAVTTVAVLDEKRVVSASYDNTLRVWDVESGKTVHTLEGHTKAVTVVVALDEKSVTSASEDNTLRVWDVESGKVARTLEGHTETVLAVAVLDEKSMVSVSRDNSLRVWDVESGEAVRTLEGHIYGVSAVAVLDEKSVVSASYDNTLRVWDVESGKTVRTLEGHTSGVNVVAVLDEKRVVSASSDNTMRVWDAESGEVRAVFALEAAVLAMTAENGVVVAGDKGGGVHFFDFDESS